MDGVNIGNINNVFKVIAIPANKDEWTTAADQHQTIKIEKNDTVLRTVIIWFAAGNQDYTKIQIKLNKKLFLPSPYSQASGSGSTGGDFLSGNDIVYPAFRIDEPLEKGDTFEIFYQNSDNSIHTVTINFELEDISPKIIQKRLMRKEKQKELNILTKLLNRFEETLDLKPTAPEKIYQKGKKEPQPDEPDADAYYDYDKNNEPEY